MLAANHAAGHHSNGGICGQPIAGQLAQRLLESRRTASELGGAVCAGALGQRFADAILCRPNGLPLEIDLPTFALVEYVTAPASRGLQITPEVAKKTVRLQAGVELWIAPVAPTRKKEPNSA